MAVDDQNTWGTGAWYLANGFTPTYQAGGKGGGTVRSGWEAPADWEAVQNSTGYVDPYSAEALAAGEIAAAEAAERERLRLLTATAGPGTVDGVTYNFPDANPYVDPTGTTPIVTGTDSTFDWAAWDGGPFAGAGMNLGNVAGTVIPGLSDAVGSQGFEVPPGSAIDTGNPALDTYVPGGGVDGPNPVSPANTIDPVTQTPVPDSTPLNQGNFTDDLNAWQDSVYEQTPLINSYNRSAGLWEDLQGQRSSGEGIASINPDAPGQLYQAFGEAYQYDPNAGNYRSINTGNVIGHPGAPPADIGVQPNYDDYTASTLPANSAIPGTVVPGPVVPEDTGAGGEGTGGTNF